MSWETFAGSVGLPAIVAGIVAFLFGVWKDRLKRFEQARIDDRFKRLETSLLTAGHVQRAQYEKELKLLDELWEIGYTLWKDSVLCCDPEGVDDKLRHEVATGNMNLMTKMYRFRPFIVQPVFSAAKELLAVSTKLSNLVHEDGHTVEQRNKAHDAFQEPMNLVLNAIHNRINELSSVPQHEEPESIGDTFFLPFWRAAQKKP